MGHESPKHILASAGWATAVGTVALSGVAVGADEDVKMPDLETAAVLGTGGGTEEELLAGVEGTASVAHLEALGEDSAVASSDCVMQSALRGSWGHTISPTLAQAK